MSARLRQVIFDNQLADAVSNPIDVSRYEWIHVWINIQTDADVVIHGRLDATPAFPITINNQNFELQRVTAVGLTIVPVWIGEDIEDLVIEVDNWVAGRVDVVITGA